MEKSRIADLLQGYYSGEEGFEISRSSEPAEVWESETVELRLHKISKRVGGLQGEFTALAVSRFEALTGPGLAALGARLGDVRAAAALAAVASDWEDFFGGGQKIGELAVVSDSLAKLNTLERLRVLPGRLRGDLTLAEAAALQRLATAWPPLGPAAAAAGEAALAALPGVSAAQFADTVRVGLLLLPISRQVELRAAAELAQTRIALGALTLPAAGFEEKCAEFLNWADSRVAESQAELENLFPCEGFRLSCEVAGVGAFLETTELPETLAEFERGIDSLEQSRLSSAAIEEVWAGAAPAVLHKFIVLEPLESLRKSLKVFRTKAAGARLEDLASSILPRICVEAVLFCADNLSSIHALVQRASSRFQADDSLHARCAPARGGSFT